MSCVYYSVEGLGSGVLGRGAERHPQNTGIQEYSCTRAQNTGIREYDRTFLCRIREYGNTAASAAVKYRIQNTRKYRVGSRAKASPLSLFCCLIAITHALQPEATNARLGGSESWLALPLPPDDAPHSPHASTPHHLLACQTNMQATQSQRVASLIPFCYLIAITRVLQPEATNARLGGSESWLALPSPPDDAPHSPHASTPHHLVACQTNKQATQSQSVVDALVLTHCNHTCIATRSDQCTAWRL